MFRGLSYVVRTRMAPASVATSIRTAVRRVDPNLVVLDVRPMDAIVGNTIATRKFNATLLGLFAALALALAATGVYGVLQYSVVQRKREMGIRIAVGATSMDLVRLIVGQALGLAGIGVAIGVAGAELRRVLHESRECVVASGLVRGLISRGVPLVLDGREVFCESLGESGRAGENCGNAEYGET